MYLCDTVAMAYQQLLTVNLYTSQDSSQVIDTYPYYEDTAQVS